MCSISGFSLSQNSKINPRKLSHALLVEMDVRGNQAAGYAWQSSTASGVYKKDVSGEKLNMKQMSKGTRLAVLHTRYATHGSIKVMANNHPVMSPDNNIALVHNGVIYNHSVVRSYIDQNLPEVDSSVIPALLQQYDNDFQRFEMLDGDAAVAWLDETDRLTLNVARISHSPLCVAQVEDGSFIFASTESILMSALTVLGLVAVYLENVAERVLFKVVDGVLTTVEALPAQNSKYEEKLTYSSSYYRNLTSGNKGGVIGSPKVQEITPTELSSLFTDRYDRQETFIPESWYGVDADAYFERESTPREAAEEFPQLEDYHVNDFGEYFDRSGMFMGSFDDMVEMGYLRENDMVAYLNSRTISYESWE